mgnify:CR=1 FL=1
MEDTKQQKDPEKTKIKKRPFMIAVFVVGAVFVVLGIMINTPNTQERSITPVQKIEDVVINETELGQLTHVLGEPLKQENTPQGPALLYKGTSENWPTTVVPIQNKVGFIRIHTFSPENSFSEWEKKIGGSNPQQIFAPESRSNIYGYYYEDIGALIKAGGDKRIAFEILRFPPMSLQQFLQTKYGVGYSLSAPSEGHEF